MSRNSRSIRLLGPIALAIVALLASNAAADVQFNDSAFSDADWQLTVIRGHSIEGGPFVPNPAAGTLTSVQQERGGVLGSYRGVNIVVNASVGSAQNFVYGFQKRVGAVYNAAVSGAFGCISYSEFGKTNSSTESTGCKCQDASMALMQNNVTYIAIPAFVTPSAPSNWTQSQILVRSADDFCAMPGYLEGNCVHPNFTQTGLPIQFGFIRGNYNTPGGGASTFTTTAGIDNWQVTVLTTCTACADGIDNDENSCLDFPTDLGCQSPLDDTESGAGCSPLPECSDGYDNDGDGCADYPADLGCADQADAAEAGALCTTEAVVPALSTWGLIALTAGLLGMAVYLLRRSA